MGYTEKSLLMSNTNKSLIFAKNREYFLPLSSTAEENASAELEAPDPAVQGACHGLRVRDETE